MTTEKLPQLTETAHKILATLRANGPQTPAQMIAAVGCTKVTLYKNLKRLKKTGKLLKRELDEATEKGGRPPCEWRLADVSEGDE